MTIMINNFILYIELHIASNKREGEPCGGFIVWISNRINIITLNKKYSYNNICGICINSSCHLQESLQNIEPIEVQAN